MKTLLKKYKKQIISILILIVAFISGIIFTYTPWVDERNKIINIVLKHPKIFEFDTTRRKFLINTVNICRNLTDKTWKKTLYGDNLESAKEECMDKIMLTIQRGVSMTSQLDSGYGYLPVNIGHLSNSFSMSATNISGFTKEQNQIYTNNIRMLIEAIPDNIPTIDTLKNAKIIKVKYYDHYAKIKYANDAHIEELETNNIPYKGQF